MRIIASMLAVLALTASARDTNRYDRVETRGGIEFSQRGGLGNSNEVVTAFNREAFWEAAESDPGFSNAVHRVGGGGGGISEEKDPTVWLTNGTLHVHGDTITPLTSESDPVLAAFKTNVWNDVSAYSGNTNMTQKEKTDLLLKIVERFKPEED